MRRRNAYRVAGTVLLLSAMTVIGATAQVFTTLVDFDGTDGAYPQYMALVQGTDGNLYGTTGGGGFQGAYCKSGCGVVFKVTPKGTLTALYGFCQQANCTDGYEPQAGLTLSTDGNFYGTTYRGGASDDGTVFKITRSGEFTTLHSFNGADGAFVTASVTQGIDGNFYGLTLVGGIVMPNCYLGCGTVFKITPEGVLITLHAFESTDGNSPTGGLVLGTDGNFYGVTAGGGVGAACLYSTGCGTVFKMTPSGAVTTLYSFCGQANCTDGYAPVASLIQATDGNFYGTTYAGGTRGYGTVFKITDSGEFTTLHSFIANPNDGANPYAGLVQATDGNLYGTTYSGGNCCGTIFSITPGGTYLTLHYFDATGDAFPQAGLAQATSGVLYGTTAGGYGSIFSLDMGLGPFVTFVRFAGRVGRTGPILGQGLAGTTGVSINGIQANFTVVSDTFIRATVPEGATTGFVTVTTPSGTLTSNVPFHVIP